MGVLFIFRRDFRIYDNTGFNIALEIAQRKKCPLYPIFIFTPEQASFKNKYISLPAIIFMCESLRELGGEINLSLLYGDNISVLEDITNQVSITHIVFNRDYTKYAKKRDLAIEKFAKKKSIIVESPEDYTVFKLNRILTKAGKPQSIYGYFAEKFVKLVKTWEKDILKCEQTEKLSPETTKLPEISSMAGEELTKHTINPPATILPHDLPRHLPDIFVYLQWLKQEFKEHSRLQEGFKPPITGGRSKSLEILDRMDDFYDYNDSRDILTYTTTRLSAGIKFGCVSIREVLASIMKTTKKSKYSDNQLIAQIAWHDFYANIMYNREDTLDVTYHDVNYWSDDAATTDKFIRWCRGMTGYPIVDAGIREMLATGYMHNRARLIVADFLTKVLHVSWDKGAKFFARHLIDYDPANNSGNWQWIAGTNTDARQRYRVFAPDTQQKRFDPDFEYIRIWIPELKDVPNVDLAAWSKKYADHTDTGYPSPIVDYSTERKEHLSRL